MAPKQIISLYVYCKDPHYDTVSLMDPKDSIIIRLICSCARTEIHSFFLAGLHEVHRAIVVTSVVRVYVYVYVRVTLSVKVFRSLYLLNI